MIFLVSILAFAYAVSGFHLRAERFGGQVSRSVSVVATDFSFKRKGTAMMEHGTITYALDKTADGWRIAAWTWTW